MITIATKAFTADGVRHGFTMELTRGSLFIRVSGVGELFMGGGLGRVWSPWSEVIKAEGARA